MRADRFASFSTDELIEELERRRNETSINDTGIDWRSVIMRIKRERKFPMKTIAAHIGVCRDTIHSWVSGECCPRRKSREELLRLAGME